MQSRRARCSHFAELVWINEGRGHAHSWRVGLVGTWQRVIDTTTA
ncbi:MULTISPECIES: hypothetical protein [Micromonospora]|nr:hypothetical protein [Micromonospora sp. CPM1]